MLRMILHTRLSLSVRPGREKELSEEVLVAGTTRSARVTPASWPSSVSSMPVCHQPPLLELLLCRQIIDIN